MKPFKVLFDLFVIAAAVSLIVGLISRVLMVQLACGLEARSFLGFSIVCLLFALTIGMRELVRK
ncbi:MAG: hypothetical protein WC299_14100 [Kiritimatiellia bacterium]